MVSTVNVRYAPTVQLPSGTVYWRVRATAAPVILRPEADRHFQAPETPYSTWEPVAGATSYAIEVGPDPQFIDTNVPGYAARTSRTTAAYLTGYQSSGTYYWPVRAELTSGYATAWTAARPYQVDGLPPVVRTAPADDFGPAVRDVVLDWEPVPGAAAYQLQVSTDDAFLSTVSGGDVSNVVATEWSPSATLPNDEYYWRVRAVDASGNAAPWPDTPFRFRRAWPQQPTLVHPVGTAPADRPLFYEWTPIERASSYTLTVTNAATGRSVCSRTTVHTTLADDSCVPASSGRYAWKVVATDGPSSVVTAEISQTAAVFDYAVPTSGSPAAPGTLTTSMVTGEATSMTGIAAFPPTGSRDVCALSFPDTCANLRQAPVLTWDPVPGATSYLVTVANDRELTTARAEYTVNQPMFTHTSTLRDGQAGAAYFWVVRPCAGGVCAPVTGIDDVTHSFAKKSVGPMLVAPANGARLQDDITLDWTSELDALRAPGADVGSALRTPAATEARTYTVETSTSPTFATLLESATVEETRYTSPSTTYPEGIVYWRVRATDGGSNPTVYSETRSFEKRSPVPALLAPRNGAALGADYTLSWEPLAFAGSYDLQVFADGNVNPVATATTRHTSWAPSSPFPVAAGAYTWRVRRVDARGRPGDWSALFSFRVEGFPLSAAAPAAGAVVPPTGGLFTWLPDARATGYRFERRRPNDPNNSVAETVTTQATAWAPTSTLAAGTTQWRVTALDSGGKELGSSSWREFVVIDPPAVATPVTISGSGRVGTELRAFAPTFDPVAEMTTYQWYRGLSTISGATGDRYTVTSNDVGSAITVRATGTRTGYRQAASTSNEIVAVTGDAPIMTAPPSIEGVRALGETLTVRPGTWAENPTLRYQWYRDDVAIPSRATGTTYTVTADDVAHRIHVVETASLSGRASGSAASDAVVPAPGAAPVNSSAPRLSTSGPVRPGDTVSVLRGSWSPSAELSYQWYRDGIAIPGQTESSYQLLSQDVGRRIHAVETARVLGRLDGQAATGAIVANGAVRAVTAPRIQGTPVVGSTMTVNPGTWSSAQVPGFDYQWFRSGQLISGATGSTYTLTAEDAARPVHVVVTATTSGYLPGTAASATTTVAKMSSATSVSLSPTRATVKERVTVSVQVSVSGLSSPGGTVTIYDGARKLTARALSSGAATYQLPKLGAGKHTIKVVYGGGTQVTGSSRSVRLTVTKR